MSARFLTTRRRVMQQIATTLAATAVSLPTHSSPRPAFVVCDPDLSAAIDALISHRASAAIIGEAYLTQFEEERSADILMRKIRERLSVDSQCIDERTLLSWVRTDFERGDIVNLRGWLLSRTEARMCALYTF